MNQNLHVNITNFHMKGFTLGLALKQRQNATCLLRYLITDQCVLYKMMNKVSFLVVWLAEYFFEANCGFLPGKHFKCLQALTCTNGFFLLRLNIRSKICFI